MPDVLTAIDEQTQFSNGEHSRNNGLQSGNAGLLSLRDISARLETDYGRLRRLADAPGIGELLGAVDVPGAKGVRYAPRAVEVFRRLIRASDAKQLTPGTATAWLKLNEEREAEDAIAGKPQLSNSANDAESPAGTDLMFSGFAPAAQPSSVDIVAVAQAQGRAQGLAGAERVLTAQEAAEVLSISPALLRKTVPTWKRFGNSSRGDRWLLSDLVSR